MNCYIRLKPNWNCLHFFFFFSYQTVCFFRKTGARHVAFYCYAYGNNIALYILLKSLTISICCTHTHTYLQPIFFVFLSFNTIGTFTIYIKPILFFFFLILKCDWYSIISNYMQNFIWLKIVGIHFTKDQLNAIDLWIFPFVPTYQFLNFKYVT